MTTFVIWLMLSFIFCCLWWLIRQPQTVMPNTPYYFVEINVPIEIRDHGIQRLWRPSDRSGLRLVMNKMGEFATFPSNAVLSESDANAIADVIIEVRGEKANAE